jgi:hypothetical protein
MFLRDCLSNFLIAVLWIFVHDDLKKKVGTRVSSHLLEQEASFFTITLLADLKLNLLVENPKYIT